MFDHAPALPFSESVANGEPQGPDHCHIYYIHQDGSIYYQSNALFDNCQRDTSNRRETESNEAAETFCGDDRLTLIHLPTITDVNTQNTDIVNHHITGPVTAPDTIPMFFEKKLKNICSHCECKKKILWHNFHRDEQHFDACFRYVDGPPNSDRRCFLKLYSLKVPFLSDLTVTFSMVHHIRAEGPNFVETINTQGGNQGHMLAFISGLKSKHIRDLLTGLVFRWQDIASDHLSTSAGMTPRLFVAALLSQYGSIISGRIRDVYGKLKGCDINLKNEIQNLRKEEPQSTFDTTTPIRNLSHDLIEMNIQLTGTRSTMNYLADSANCLVIDITPFEAYVKARLHEWNENRHLENLKISLQKLDSCREQIRDNDKLIMVRKNMSQYKTDIKSLQQHIEINVGMIRNLIAERDRAIQLSIATCQNSIAEKQKSILEKQESIAKNTERDSAKMKIIAILTALFLPATFMAVFLTTPMFNFLDETKPVLVELPFALYWGITLSLSILFAVALNYMNHPEHICEYIDRIPFEGLKKRLEPIHRICSERSDYLKRSNTLDIKSDSRTDSAKMEQIPSENGTANHVAEVNNGKAAKRYGPERGIDSNTGPLVGRQGDSIV